MGTKRDRNAHSTQESGAHSTQAASEYAPGSGTMDLDELDEAILHHLARYGRATNYEVGEVVGLSASAASRRIQALEAAGAIRGYRAQVDARLLGKRMTVFIRVTLERQSAPVLAAFVTAIRCRSASPESTIMAVFTRTNSLACPVSHAWKPALR